MSYEPQRRASLNARKERLRPQKLEAAGQLTSIIHYSLLIVHYNGFRCAKAVTSDRA